MITRITIAVLCFFSTSEALAQNNPPTLLEQAQELYAEQRYREALSVIEPFAMQDGLDAELRLQAIRQLAMVRLVLRDDAGTQQALQAALSRDPGFDLGPGDHPPRFVEALAHARAANPEHVTVRLSGTNTRIEERTLIFEAIVEEHSDAVASVVAMHRRVEEADFVPLELSSGPPFHGSTSLASTADAVEYYLEARAPSGTALARTGSADAPIRLVVAPRLTLRDSVVERVSPNGRAIRRRGPTVPLWVWVATGALVASVTTFGIVLAEPGPPRNGSWASVELGR